ncbi:MAG: protein-glutamate O-methyltransferase CheR [Calditrichaeota bacterium]|nr:MAG: protein-glutamate O-methyltransferase CheR [Calditrichota bacterium]
MLQTNNLSALYKQRFGQRSAKPLSDEEFQELSRFIYQKTGIEFKERKKYLLQNRLTERMTELGVKSYREYISLLKHDFSGREMKKLAVSITINETSFMRNLPQLLEFQNRILPELVQKVRGRINKPIRVWSAGCSSGEEPYSIGMLALEKFPLLASNRQLEIIGTDINMEVLERARRGKYSNLNLKNLAPKYLSTYFRRTVDGYEVVDKVKQLVQFDYLNLIDTSRMKALVRSVDVIFFRNVMIYFGIDVRKKIISDMYDLLQPGGYLLLGHSESLHGISKAFKLKSVGKSLVYYKEAN